MVKLGSTEQQPEEKVERPALHVVGTRWTPDDDDIRAILDLEPDQMNMKYLFAWQYLTQYLLQDYADDKLKELIDTLG